MDIKLFSDFILAVLLLAAIGLGAFAWLRRRSERAHQESPGITLQRHARDRSDYQMFIGLPPDRPTRWGEVARVDDEQVVLTDRSVIPLPDVADYFVTYPGGSLVERQGSSRLRLPPWVTGLECAVGPEERTILPQDLRVGARRVSVVYGVSTSKPRSRDHYSTTVTNLSVRRIRVRLFGAFHVHALTQPLDTASGKYFSPFDFRQWYGQKSEWIEPGESVTDPNNYGSRPILWVYFCEDDLGDRFVGGGSLA